MCLLGWNSPGEISYKVFSPEELISLTTVFGRLGANRVGRARWVGRGGGGGTPSTVSVDPEDKITTKQLLKKG